VPSAARLPRTGDGGASFRNQEHQSLCPRARAMHDPLLPPRPPPAGFCPAPPPALGPPGGALCGIRGGVLFLSHFLRDRLSFLAPATPTVDITKSAFFQSLSFSPNFFPYSENPRQGTLGPPAATAAAPGIAGLVHRCADASSWSPRGAGSSPYRYQNSRSASSDSSPPPHPHIHCHPRQPPSRLCSARYTSSFPLALFLLLSGGGSQRQESSFYGRFHRPFGALSTRGRAEPFFVSLFFRSPR